MIPTLFVPGLACSARLYSNQIARLWAHGPVIVANHTGGETMAEIAGAILLDAPPRFRLVGLSMGGYIAFEIMRQAAGRVERLALLDTSARPDKPEQSDMRCARMARAQAGAFMDVTDETWPMLVHSSRLNDMALKEINRAMARETGVDAYCRQQRAIMSRPDSRPDLVRIACPTLVLVGDADALTPPELAREMADGIAGSRLVIVPECGHLSTLERPAAVSDALEQWDHED
jgi:pimeloyl-ACP methyl ester carboxylesterase